MAEDGTLDVEPNEEFVSLLTGSQGRLYGYIMSLLPDSHQAKDVLQETNLVAWRKSEEFQPGTDFGAWVAKIAFYQVMAHRSRHKRDRHIYSDDMVSLLAKEAKISALDERTVALDTCLRQLSAGQRDLLWQRYTLGSNVSEIAQRLGKKVGALRVTLFRIRQSLLACVQQKLDAEVQS